MTIKNVKVWMYKQLARFSRLYFYSLFFVAIITIPLVFWRTKIPLIPEYILNICFRVFVFAAFLMLLLLLVWGWYFVWFRYAVYGAAHVVSLIRRLFKNAFFQIIIILAASAWFWVLLKRLFLGEEYNLREILIFSHAIKILVIATLVFTIWKIYKSRKRIVISIFKNYTGDKQLNPIVEGIAARILNEMNRLSQLLKTIDDIQPESKTGVVEPTLDIQDMGKNFEEVFGSESYVEIPKVGKIPLRPLYGFLGRLARGPIIFGSIHLKGEKLILTACLKGGNLKGSWEISTDDIEKPAASRSEQVIQISDQLVCRIFAHISQISKGNSPRWKAMRHYAEALRLYRETLRTIEKRKLNLIKAKNECSRSLRHDSKFVQCYYNLGIIYNELKSYDAAIAAFRKALETAPDNYYCYYQLARLYYSNKKNYFDARWFCEQALTIYPTDADHWNLWAVIKFKRNYNIGEDDYKNRVDIPDDVAQYFMNASALAWRALCKSIITGEKIPQFKETARICIRNLAKITGMRKAWRSRCLFKQSIFLDPDDNDLHFEIGKYYYRYYSDYRKNKIIKAYKAFKRVFEDDKEVDDPFSFWAFYINVNAQLSMITKNKKKKEEYKEVVGDGFFHFLDAAAEIIQNKKEKPEDIDIHEKQVSDALNFKEREYGFLVELNDILNGNFTSIDEWKNRKIQKMEDYIYKWSSVFRQYFPDLSEGFLRWSSAQAEIKSTKLILDSESRNVFSEVTYRLNWAKELLIEYNPNEFKILDLYRYLGESFFRLELREEALKQAREAVRLDPYNWEVRNLLGNIYFALNDYQKAVSEFEISARLEELPPAVLIEILKKIGEAYGKNGKILRDPKQRKNSFNKAVEFFTDSLEILEDKSYENNDEETDRQYFEILAEIHFYLGTFYRELLKYDDAMTHFKIAREMGYETLAILLNIGWSCFECGDYSEAEQTFEEAESNTGGTSAEVEIKLGIALSQLERVTVLDDEILSEESLRYLRDVKEGQETKNLIDIVANTGEQSRLSALYYECRGRLYFKQEEFEDAEKEFEKSLSYRANPRVYYYLAEMYRKIAGLSEGPLRNLCMAQTRSALSLCLRNDFQEKYKKEVSELLDKLSASES